MIGSNQEFIADVIEHTKTVVGDIGNNRSERLIAFRQIAKRKRVSILPLASLGNRKNREALIFSYTHALKSLRVFLVFIDQFIF